MKDVKLIGDVKIYDNVEIGMGSVIYGPAVLGQPPRDAKEGELKLAIGLGAIYAGATVAAWYPITPSSSLPESMIE